MAVALVGTITRTGASVEPYVLYRADGTRVGTFKNVADAARALERVIGVSTVIRTSRDDLAGNVENYRCVTGN